MTRRDFIHAALAAPACASIAAAQPTRVRTIAGTGLSNPYGLVPGPDGALYFCEVDSGLIRQLDVRAGTIVTVAAHFSAPHEVRFDRGGALYVVERDGHVVRRIDAKTKTVTSVAGTGTRGFAGDEGPADQAQLNQPHSIAFDANGDLLICDIGNRRIRRVDLKTGTIRTFAGNGGSEPTPDEAPIAGTPLNGPRSIDVDPAGSLYLVLREGNAIFRVDPRANRLTRIAGTGLKGFTGDNGPALQATFNGPKGIACAGDYLYVADTENHAIRRIAQRTGRIETVLGTGQKGSGPDGDPLQCALNRPHGLCFYRGVLYVSDSENNRIRAVSGIE